MKNKLYFIILLVIVLITGCINQKSSTNDTKFKPVFKVQAGLNSKSGIIENTDIEQVENTPVDAYSGATKTGFNAGVKIILPIRKNGIETGVDFLFNQQTFTYQDNINSYYGNRDINTSQIVIPITYNIGFFRKKFDEGLFTLKLGYLVQYNSAKVNNKTATLPDYTIYKFSNGFTFGISTSPFRFKNGSKLGFYVDLYRGSQIYRDFYNKKDFDMPGSAFIKYGISFQF